MQPGAAPVASFDQNRRRVDQPGAGGGQSTAIFRGPPKRTRPKSRSLSAMVAVWNVQEAYPVLCLQ